MSTITKERVAEFIKNPLNNGLTRGEQMELARIAQASLEAEPVAYIRDGFKADGVHFCGGIITAEEHERTKPALSDRYNWKHQPLYAAPPAPVYVPAAMEMDDDFDSAFEHGKAVGWNAYRAAMLQGAEPAQEWIPCSERMPEQFKAILVFNEYGEVWSGAYDRYWNFYCDNELVECVTHWMPLPAAPQQEDDNG